MKEVFLAVGMILTVFAVQACNEDSDSGSVVDTLIDVPHTGQTISYVQGDDGAIQAGLRAPGIRFTDSGNATVSDNWTGFVWTQDAGCVDPAPWEETLKGARNVADGQCGLTDGSEPGDWRIANIRELQSLVDFGTSEPALTKGHPFLGIGADTLLWSSTTYDGDPNFAYALDLNTGAVVLLNKSEKAGCMVICDDCEFLEF